MADIEHSDIGTGEIHLIYNFVYADAAARTGAAGLLSTDVGKLALQSDDNSLWLLTDESPVTWKDIGTSSSSRASNPLDDVGQLIVGGASGVETKLEPGAEGEFLQIVSGEPAWGSAALTLSNDSVTNSLLANMAEATIQGRAAGAGTGDPTDLTAAQVRTILLEMQRWVFNFTADGDAYIAADVAMTVDIGTAAIGTGTLAYEKSTTAAPGTFSSTTLPATLQAGAWLKVSAASVTGFVAVELKRTA